MPEGEGGLLSDPACEWQGIRPENSDFVQRVFNRGTCALSLFASKSTPEDRNTALAWRARACLAHDGQEWNGLYTGDVKFAHSSSVHNRAMAGIRFCVVSCSELRIHSTAYDAIH